MKSEFAVIIDNCMSGICSTLETNDNICFFGKHICDLTFSFVAPAGADDCF